jgi:predicted RND superfamily exporter protein
MTSYVKTGYNTDRVTKAILAKLEAFKFPKGYRYVPAGEIESRQKSFGGLSTAILIAIFGVLATLVLEFRGFKSTLIVLSVVPLGIVGGLTLLFLTGNTLSFTSMIGFIALVGIEVKTSILLVDFTNQLREQGLSLDQAVQKAGEIRFVPVLLTTMTAIGGLLPIALGGSALYSSLAWVIIGGLISSTVLARLVTPVMYKLLPPARPRPSGDFEAGSYARNSDQKLRNRADRHFGQNAQITIVERKDVQMAERGYSEYKDVDRTAAIRAYAKAESAFDRIEIISKLDIDAEDSELRENERFALKSNRCVEQFKNISKTLIADADLQDALSEWWDENGTQ